MPSLDGLFESYSRYVVRHRRPVMVAWLVMAVAMVPFALDSMNIVSYSINIPTSNNQSQVAENLVSTQFSSYSQPDNTYYAVLQGPNVLTPSFYQRFLQLNQSLYNSLLNRGLQNITSIYSVEYSLLNNLARNVPSAYSNTSLLVNDTAKGLTSLAGNLSKADASVHQVYNQAINASTSFSSLVNEINYTNHAEYTLLDGVNGTASLLFGVPNDYLKTWSTIYLSSSGSYMSTPQINAAANQTYVEATADFGGSRPVQVYYSEFYNNWYSETQTMVPSTVESNILQLGGEAINKTVPQYVVAEGMNQTQSAFYYTILNSFNLTDYSSPQKLDSVTLGIFTYGLSSYQAQLSEQAFLLGRNPSPQSLVNLASTIISQEFPKSQADFILGAYRSSLNGTLVEYSIEYFVNESTSVDPSLPNLLLSNFNITFSKFAKDAFSIGEPQNASLLQSYQKELMEGALLSNSTVLNALTENYNESVPNFVSDVLSASQTGDASLRNLSLSLSARLIDVQVGKVFYLNYNPSGVLDLVKSIEDGSLAPATAANLILSGDRLWTGSFESLPVYPTRGLLNQFVSPSGNTTIVMLQFSSPPSKSTQTLFESLVSAANSPGFETHYTATSILDNDVQAVITDSERVALPFGILVAVIVTGLFFLSPVAALVPMLMFGVALEVGFGLTDIILGKIQGQTLSYISPIIIAVLGLGLASDYAVLMLNRFRQEFRGDSGEAGRTTVRWAGEAVFTSGLTVVMSYLALSLSGIPLFSDVGTANVIVVSVILACSLSLLPAVMTSSPKRIFWPGHALIVRPSRLSRITKASMKRPKLVVGVLVLITVGATILSVTLPVNVNFLSLAPNTPGKVGLDQITNNFGGSSLLPEYVVVQLPGPISTGNNTFNQSMLSFLSEVESTIRGQTGVSAVYGPVSPYNSSIPVTALNSLPSSQRAVYAGAISAYLTKDNSTTYFKVVFKGDPFSNTVLSEATSLGNTLSKINSPGYTILMGGISTDSAGILQYVFSILPKIIVVLVVAIFIVLLLQLRSVFTPLRLIATILSSVTWALGLVWIIFYGLSGLSIYIFAPLFLVTTMLGVGMDYDIFLITRVREEAMKGYSDEEAILRTSQTTAGVITVLGIILGSVFFGLVLSQVKLLQQIGLTLTLGVLMDTFIVWLMFVPAIMVLAKRLNWWPGNPRRKNNESQNKPREEND